MENSIFFHTQVVPEYGEERVIIYDQDAEYKTHVINCRHHWEDTKMACYEEASYAHESQIVAFTTSFYRDP